MKTTTRGVSYLPLPILATAMLVLSGCSLDDGRGDHAPAPSPGATDGAGNSIDTSYLTFPPAGNPGVQEDNIVYRTVDGQALTLNACTPADSGTSVPAILLIHGGGFVRGSKGSESMRNLCAGFAEAGMASFSVEYRLAPAHPFPAAVDDVQAAVRWLREPAQVTRFGIDPTRIGALGNSAGATLAMELATLGDGDLTSGSRVAAVAALSGASDITVAGLARGELDERRIDLVRQYLDCPVMTDCPQAADASPLYQVDPTDASLFIAHSIDEFIPVEQAEAMIQALRDAGVTVMPRLVPGHRHGINYVDTTMWREIVTFFRENL